MIWRLFPLNSHNLLLLLLFFSANINRIFRICICIKIIILSFNLKPILLILFNPCDLIMFMTIRTLPFIVTDLYIIAIVAYLILAIAWIEFFFLLLQSILANVANIFTLPYRLVNAFLLCFLLFIIWVWVLIIWFNFFIRILYTFLFIFLLLQTLFVINHIWFWELIALIMIISIILVMW